MRDNNVKAGVRLGIFAIVIVATVTAGCDNTESMRIDETREKLVGTWLREIQADGLKARRVLVIAQDGKFTDRAYVVGPDGQSERQDFAGEWSYDGTNFKRRYLQENGRQFSGGKMRYATYQLASVSRSEFVAKENIENREITYRRVSDGTQP